MHLFYIHFSTNFSLSDLPFTENERAIKYQYPFYIFSGKSSSALMSEFIIFLHLFFSKREQFIEMRPKLLNGQNLKMDCVSNIGVTARNLDIFPRTKWCMSASAARGHKRTSLTCKRYQYELI